MAKKRKKTFVVETTSRELIGPFVSAEAAQRSVEKVYGEDARYTIRPVLSSDE